MTSPMSAPTFDRRASLYLGTDIQGTSTVSPAEWQGFIASEIAPRFPAGYTVSDVFGGWRYPDGRTVSEPTHQVSVVFPHADCPDVTAKLADIASAYRAQFRQDAVLETIDHTEAVFL